MASSSSTPSQLTNNKWDVFISFRGKDTRRGFLSFLFKSLKEKEIDVFKDENLDKGAEITPSLLQTIQESCISIVIFSKNYADSPWCLDELVQINECRENFKQMVVPVFYRIDPTDVQELGGNYKNSLYKLKKEHKPKLRRWRRALKTISNELSGWVSKESKDDEELVQKIVDYVWKKLCDMPSNDSCGDKLVGIESCVEEVKSLLDVKVNDRRTIGIWGMPGIGKSTLAGEVYQQMKDGFDSHYFVLKVNDRITKEIPIDLRDEIIGKLLRDDHLKIGTPSLSGHIKRKLGRKKVLMVFDDVAVLDQLSVLAGDCNLYGEGSRIIVTCTDKQVLVNVCEEEHIYEVKKLNYDEALQVFCLFAFHSNEPKEGFEKVSDEVISYAGGNPLVLRVLGSNFYGMKKDDWVSELAKLKGIPNKEILEILRVSYDGLDRNAQRIFLDIACFYSTIEMNYIESLLESFGFFAKSGIRRLLDKSLITISRVDVTVVSMHNLVREMGKEIVNGECKNPGGRSRLWDSEDILHVFKTNSGTENIEAISLYMHGSQSIELSSNAFSKMHRLRFLCIHDYSDEKLSEIIPDGLDFLPEQLACIEWHGYPLKSLPLKFCPKNLVHLELKNSSLEQLWSDRYEPFENLKVLGLGYGKLLKRISNSFQAPKLEKLCLEGCKNLVEIPSLVHFERLETLNLVWCVKLKQYPDVPCNLTRLLLNQTPIKQLPSSIGNCYQLVSLFLSWCRELENLPDCIGQLESLERLDLNNCLKLSELPASINQLRNLKELDCEGCEGLTTLPPLTGLNSLERLHLDYCGISEIPESISTLISLWCLSLSGCKRLGNLPKLPKCLTLFSAYGCTSLEFVSRPFLSQGEDVYGYSGTRLIFFGNCTNMNKEARLKIMEDALSYSYSNKKRERKFRLWIPGMELWPKMRYKTSGARISLELGRHHHIIGFHFSVVVDPQLVNFDKEDYFNVIVCDASFIDASGVTHHSSYEVDLPEDLSSEYVSIWYQTKWNPTFNPKDHFIFTHASFEFGCCQKCFMGDHVVKLVSAVVVGCGVEPILEYFRPEQELMQMVEDH